MTSDVAMLTTLQDKVDPAWAALVIVDVQNDFVADEGWAAAQGWSVAEHQRAAERLKRLAPAARRAGVPVVFVRSFHDDEFLSDAVRERNRRVGLDMPRCISGTGGADFYGVKPEDGDVVVDKHRYSGFLGTLLHDALRRLGIRSVLVTGVLTEVCVEATARDAYSLDYYTVMVSDCCATTDTAAHEAALDRCRRDFGVVADSDEIISVWQSARR